MTELRLFPLRDLLIRWPGAKAVLLRHGIDPGCGGCRTLADAAEHHGIDERVLVDDVGRVTSDSSRSGNGTRAGA